MTTQVGHISFAEREFPSKVENVGKDPAFAVLKILLASVGARNTWSVGIPLQEAVSRILAGTKAGRGKNKTKTQQKTQQKQISRWFGLNHEEWWLGEWFLHCILEKGECSWKTEKDGVAAVEKRNPWGLVKQRGWFWGMCKAGNYEGRTFLYPDWEGTNVCLFLRGTQIHSIQVLQIFPFI